SVPERRGSHLYYWRMEAGKQYKIFCRRLNALDAAEEVLIDENALAEGKEYCKVWIFEPSPDQNLLAYGVDFTGSMVYDLFVKALRPGQILSGPIHNAAWTVAWASDNNTLFYTLFDHAHRPYKLLRLSVSEPESPDVEIYHEVDDA